MKLSVTFSTRELVELRRLTDQAFELRDGPYVRDACEAIVEWASRTYVDRAERLVAELEREQAP